MSEAKTAQQLAEEVARDIEGRHREKGHDVADVDWDLIEACVLDGFLGALAVVLDRDAIRAKIVASLDDVAEGRLDLTDAADEAADAVLKVIRG
jgi:hypothetical protein